MVLSYVAAEILGRKLNVGGAAVAARLLLSPRAIPHDGTDPGPEEASPEKKKN